MRTRLSDKSIWPALAAAAAVLCIWQIAGAIADIPHILPTPVSVLQRTWQLRETLLLHHLPETLLTILAGWGLSIIIGTGLGILMYKSKYAEAMLHPVLLITQTIPVMCISPLFVLWMGYTIGARLLAVVLSTFYTITLNTYDGLRSADPDKAELLRTYGAGNRSVFFRLEVPTAIPRFMTALKMTAPWAVVDAAAAEWLGANAGLGYFSRRMISSMDGAGVFAPILLLTVIALLLMALINRLDRRFAAYRAEL